MAEGFSFVDVAMSCRPFWKSAAEITAAFAGNGRLRLSFFRKSDDGIQITEIRILCSVLSPPIRACSSVG